jgi:lysophospholipid acyltransferase (LPLAT)-like uncharacterized protein
MPRPGGIGDFVPGAAAPRRWTQVASEPLFLLSNALFLLVLAPTLFTVSVRWPPLARRLQAEVEQRWRPLIYMGWHAYSWAAYLVFRGLPESIRPTSLAHDGVASRFNSRCGSWLGFHTLVYRRRAQTPPAQQIIDYVRRCRRHLVLFPDSGGPYRVLKPGIADIAQALDALVVPFAIRSQRALRLGSDMQHVLPLPTSRLELVCGAPLAGRSVDPHACGRALAELEEIATAAPTAR